MHTLIIDRYLSKEILRPFSLGVVLLTVIFVGYNLSVQLGQVNQGLIQTDTAIRLILLNTLIALEILLPTALYFSVLSAVGRMHKDSEISALQAAGVSELRIVRSAFMLAVTIAIGVALLSMVARPWAYREGYRLESEEAADFSVLNIEPGQFIELNLDNHEEGNGYLLFANGIDRKNERLQDVFLQHQQGTEATLIYAQEAQFFPGSANAEQRMEFYHGYAYNIHQDGAWKLTLKYKHFVIQLPELAIQSHYRRKAEPTLQLMQSTRYQDIAEYQGRLATPITTLIFAVLAVPLSRSNPRRSRFSLFFVALLVYVFFFSSVVIVKNWLEKGQIDAFPGLWLAYPLPLVLGFALLNTHTWRRYQHWRRCHRAKL